MGKQDGTSSRERNNPVKKRKAPSRKIPTYFFLDGVLLKRLHVDRGADLVTCWQYYPDGKTVAHAWSETRRKMRPAFRTSEVAEMLNRSIWAVKESIFTGEMRQPQKMYSLQPDRRPGRYMWSESEVMEARDLFASRHVGWKRADGRITAKPIPTKAELRAMMDQGVMTYVKTSDGEFIPMFKEITW